MSYLGNCDRSVSFGLLEGRERFERARARAPRGQLDPKTPGLHMTVLVENVNPFSTPKPTLQRFPKPLAFGKDMPMWP